jgi:hypothetical protein
LFFTIRQGVQQPNAYYESKFPRRQAGGFPKEGFDRLQAQSPLTARPVRLEDLPDDHGIYALRDHVGQIRYIGVTASKQVGFHNRINGRHVTGSEGRSHKFSHAYNIGRIWRCRDPLSAQNQTDASRQSRCDRPSLVAFAEQPISSSRGTHLRSVISNC